MITFIQGDCRTELAKLADESVNCCVTSPPYFGLRDYGVDGQIGLEATPVAFVAELVAVFREVRRVLRDDGTLWLNLGDSYWSNTATQGRNEDKATGNITGGTAKLIAGGSSTYRRTSDLKPKDLIGIPWRVAFALQADGWYLRQDIIWSKPNPMPESVQDRCTKAHEYVFLLSKSPRYHYDADAIAEPAIFSPGATAEVEREPGYYAGKHSTKNNSGRNDVSFKAIRETRNARSVWNIATRSFSEAHFATFPPELAERCIKAGCPEGGTVLDPFGGAGTTGLVADRLQRNAVLIELNPAYAAMAKRRIEKDAGLFAEVRT
jgi:DNA modification methylase